MTLGEGSLKGMAAVGATDRSSARFWIRDERPGELELRLKGAEGEHGGAFPVSFTPETDFTTSVRYPDDFPGGRPLTPGVPYRWAMRRTDDGTFLGEGKLETAPDSDASAPDEFSFAVVGGHQPFGDRGAVRSEGLSMLYAAERAFDRHRVKRVLMVGGQTYASLPERCSVFDPAYFRKVGPRSRPSLFDCTRQEVRRVYHERYRAFWAMPELQKLMQRWPSYPMISDADLFDDFGARLEHAAAVWSSVREGALDSAFDHQGLFVRGRVGPRPSSFHFDMEYGPIAAFMMDVRSQRGWYDGRHQIYSKEQLAALETFLAANERRPVLLLGTSVPFGPSHPSGWDDPLARPDRDRLVQLLAAHQQRCPTQRLVVISSDSHGVIQQLPWEQPAHQLVAGPISRSSEQLSVGLVKLERSEGEWRVRLVLIGHDGDQPKSIVEVEI